MKIKHHKYKSKPSNDFCAECDRPFMAHCGKCGEYLIPPFAHVCKIPESNMIEFRGKIRKIISRMLDNPDNCDIYPTTKCYDEMEALVKSELAHEKKRGEKLAGAVRSAISDIKKHDSAPYQCESSEGAEAIMFTGKDLDNAIYAYEEGRNECGIAFS